MNAITEVEWRLYAKLHPDWRMRAAIRKVLQEIRAAEARYGVMVGNRRDPRGAPAPRSVVA